MSKNEQKKLYTDKIYHVFSKSIFKFKIFRNTEEFDRMRELIWFYKREKPVIRYSSFLELINKDSFYKHNLSDNRDLVEIIAYCIMPTHIHLVLKQVIDKGISTFLSNALNSYTRYFNFKIKRKGPLWESRFKSVSVDTDEQLLHLTRYVHLNPVTARLVDAPKDWKYSSYKEFLQERTGEKSICNYFNVLDIDPHQYKEFVNSQIDYQRELAVIKAKFID
ncbi:MAG: transposase [Candidatus Omnitrophica bacterium]|nr:transposase [Candidatus Omnitrophota bacterium]